MKLFEDTQRLMTDLAAEGKTFALLQKKAMQKDIAEGLSQLLGTLAVAFVVILLASIALMFICVGLAFLLGQWLGSAAMGFAVMGGAFSLLLMTVYLKRETWIVAPLHMLVNSTVGKGASEESREQLVQQMAESRQRMCDTLQQLKSPDATPTNGIQRLTRWAGWGYTLFQGVRMGTALASTLSSLFGGRKGRRK